MKKQLGWLLLFLLVASARADVRVFVQDTNGVAWLKYECTAGEVVRAFALDVSVDQGQIVGIADFFRGESKSGATGYGIFPASFRDHITVGDGTNINWALSAYTPLAAVRDNPAGTLPGLNSSGVTLEFGGLWDVRVPDAVPGPTGTLCSLQLSQAANVTVAANAIRGGVVSAFPESPIRAAFRGAFVAGPAITSAMVEDGIMVIYFQGGELQTATSLDGPWTDTGQVSGYFLEPLGTNQIKFYRVRRP